MKRSVPVDVALFIVGVIVGIAIGIWSPSCQASEIDALVLGKSWHFGSNRTDDYQPNQWNYGGGMEYRTGPWIVGGLSYRDSFRKDAYAVYGGYEYSVPVGPINMFVAVRAGYLNGSGYHGLGVLPTIGIGYSRVSLETMYIPRGKNGWNCVALFLRFKVAEW